MHSSYEEFEERNLCPVCRKAPPTDGFMTCGRNSCIKRFQDIRNDIIRITRIQTVLEVQKRVILQLDNEWESLIENSILAYLR